MLFYPSVDVWRFSCLLHIAVCCALLHIHKNRTCTAVVFYCHWCLGNCNAGTEIRVTRMNGPAVRTRSRPRYRLSLKRVKRKRDMDQKESSEREEDVEEGEKNSGRGRWRKLKCMWTLGGSTGMAASNPNVVFPVLLFIRLHSHYGNCMIWFVNFTPLSGAFMFK